MRSVHSFLGSRQLRWFINVSIAVASCNLSMFAAQLIAHPQKSVAVDTASFCKCAQRAIAREQGPAVELGQDES
jgi:hypothetical protein